MNNNRISNSFFSMPPVTRALVTCHFVTCLCYTGYAKSLLYYACFDQYLILNKYQIWRLVTPFFVGNIDQQPFNMLVSIYYFYQTCYQVETQKFGRNTPAFLYYLVAIVCPLIIASAFFHPFIVSFERPLFHALVYTISRYAPDAYTYLFLFKVVHKYVPFFLLAYCYVSEPLDVFLLNFSGTFAAYVYSCLANYDFGLVTELMEGHHSRCDTAYIKVPYKVNSIFKILSSLIPSKEMFRKHAAGKNSKVKTKSSSSTDARSSGSERAHSDGELNKRFPGKGVKLGK